MTIRLFSLILVMTCSSTVYGEDEDFDFEFEFETRKKSTINDFPLQEMDAELMSDAAIAGALQASSAGNGTGKPAYLEQAEQNEKRSKEELEFENDPNSLTEAQQFGHDIPQIIPYQQPIYQMDTGRIVEHNNRGYERP